MQKIPVEKAVSQILCHDMTAILENGFGEYADDGVSGQNDVHRCSRRVHALSYHESRCIPAKSICRN